MRRIDSGWICKAIGLLRAEGHSVEPILAQAGLDAAMLQPQGSRIPFAAHISFLHLAAEATRNPCFGLHLGVAYHPRDLGLVGYLAANAPTLGDSIAIAAKYLGLFTEGVRIEVLALGGGLVRIVQHVIDPAGVSSRQLAGLWAGALVKFARVTTSSMITPSWIELHFDSVEEGEYRRVLGAPIQLMSPYTAIVLHEAQLEMRSVAADPDLLAILEQVCHERAKLLPDPQDARAQVEAVLMALLPSGGSSLEVVARRLRTSGRSLSRRLADEGTSYNEVLDHVRYELARRYLEGGNHKPKAIAAMVGYKEVSAFHHAFRRWTGTTPARYREGRRELPGD